MARLAAPRLGCGLLFLAPIALAACSKSTLADVRPKERKVLLIGVDGLDADPEHCFLEPMFPQQLPKLAELRKHAILVPLTGEHATLDPYSIGSDFAQSWAQLATGLPLHPEKDEKGVVSGSHGVRSEMVAVKNAYETLPATSAHWEAPPFWQVLGAVGVRSAIVNWWATWPAEPLNGYLVTDRFFLDHFGLGPFGPAGRVDVPSVPDSYRHGAGELTWPLELDGELVAELKQSSAKSKPPPPLQFLQRLQQLRGVARDPATIHDLVELEQAVRTDVAAKDALVALLKRDPSIRFGACYFDSFDVAAHRFWMHINPQPWLVAKDPALRGKLPVDYENYRNLMPQAASAIDALVSEVCDAMGADTTVVLVSDHSLQPDLDPGNRDFSLNPLLQRLGLLVRKSDGAVDWSKTKCFDRTEWPTMYIRRLSINFEGEWPQGFVTKSSPIERAAQWHAVHKLLKSVKLANLNYRLPNGDLSSNLIWDVQEGPIDSHFVVFQNLSGDTQVALPQGEEKPAYVVPVDELFPPRHTSARHAEPGMLMVSFPGEMGERAGRRGVPMGRKGGARDQHVAPLVLALFGVPPSSQPSESLSQADGLFWMLDLPEAQEMALTPRVDSYESLVRFKDLTSPLGARRAELRKRVEELGWTFEPPPTRGEPSADPNAPKPK